MADLHTHRPGHQVGVDLLASPGQALASMPLFPSSPTLGPQVFAGVVSEFQSRPPAMQEALSRRFPARPVWPTPEPLYSGPYLRPVALVC